MSWANTKYMYGTCKVLEICSSVNYAQNFLLGNKIFIMYSLVIKILYTIFAFKQLLEVVPLNFFPILFLVYSRYLCIHT
jgi:hypothetical protein